MGKEDYMRSIFEASPWSSRMLAVLRIVAGLLFISFGTMKMLGYPPSPVPMPPFQPASQLGLAAILEVFGGLAIVLGLLTRPIAFVLSGEMAVAYFQAHAPQSIFPTVNNGVPAVLYCFLFLYLSFAGAGAWSIDGLIARRTRRSETSRDADERRPNRAA
jgi:putative oxidoreductase